MTNSEKQLLTLVVGGLYFAVVLWWLLLKPLAVVLGIYSQ